MCMFVIPVCVVMSSISWLRTNKKLAAALQTYARKSFSLASRFNQRRACSVQGRHILLEELLWLRYWSSLQSVHLLLIWSLSFLDVDLFLFSHQYKPMYRESIVFLQLSMLSFQGKYSFYGLLSEPKKWLKKCLLSSLYSYIYF